MKKLIAAFLIAGSILLAGCNTGSAAIYDPPSDTPTEEAPTLTPFMPEKLTPTPTFTPLPTDTATATSTPSPTPEPTPTITPTWLPNQPGQVIAPILLYHHVADGYSDNRYYISISTFQQQMEALRDWGYTTVTISTIVNVLLNGGKLPARPVVLSFDDGNKDIY